MSEHFSRRLDCNLKYPKMGQEVQRTGYQLSVTFSSQSAGALRDNLFSKKVAQKSCKKSVDTSGRTTSNFLETLGLIQSSTKMFWLV